MLKANFLFKTKDLLPYCKIIFYKISNGVDDFVKGIYNYIILTERSNLTYMTTNKQGTISSGFSTKEKILESAKKLFSDYGYSSVSMSEIAKEVKITKKTLQKTRLS